MSDQSWLYILGQVLAAASVYAAIRADLREALTRIKETERRLDRLEDQRS